MCLIWIALDLQIAVAGAAKLLQSCPTLCDPLGGSPPGSPVPGILQARTLEWVAVSFSNAWKWKVKPESDSDSIHVANTSNLKLMGRPSEYKKYLFSIGQSEF